MNILQCKDCAYYYKTESDEKPCCQFFQLTLFDTPPCEDDDLFEELEMLFATDDDELGDDT